MTNFIPIFPLGIVAYPTEQVNLHIFEPRYEQLINECFSLKKHFGITTVFENKIQEIGTVMQINSIQKVYDNGELDITTIGINTFKILEVVKNIPEKLFGGAIVSHNQLPNFSNPNNQKIVIELMRKMHQLLNVTKNYKKPDDELTSFDIAHHVGLSIEEEYQLLQIENETQRLTFLLKHLKVAVYTLTQQQQIVKRIQLNGDFRNLSLDDFDFNK